jgi:hypothetical protein
MMAVGVGVGAVASRVSTTRDTCWVVLWFYTKSGVTTPARLTRSETRNQKQVEGTVALLPISDVSHLISRDISEVESNIFRTEFISALSSFFTRKTVSPACQSLKEIHSRT